MQKYKPIQPVLLPLRDNHSVKKWDYVVMQVKDWITTWYLEKFDKMKPVLDVYKCYGTRKRKGKSYTIVDMLGR